MNTPQSVYRLIMSRIPQTNYLTATAPVTTTPKAFIEQIVRQAVLMNVKPASKNNKGYSTGTRNANEMWIESWETDGGSYSFDVSSQNIGRHLLAVLGGYAVAPVAGQAGAYKHTFTPLDVSVTAQLPSFSFVPQASPLAGAIDALFPSMVCASLKLASTGASRVTGNADWRGSGEEITPSGVDFTTNAQAVQGSQNYFYHTQSKILLSADSNGGAGFSTCELADWNLGIQNSFNDNDWGCPRFVIAVNPESGAIRSILLLTDTVYDYDFTMKLRASDAAYAALKNQTPTSIVNSLIGSNIGATTAKHQMDVTLALTKYQSVMRMFKDGFAYTQIKPYAYDSGTNPIIKVELTNDVASYAI